MIHPDRFTVLSLPRGMRDTQQGLTFDAERRIIDDGAEGRVTTQYNYYDMPIFFCSSEHLKSIGGVDNLKAIDKIEDVYTEVLDRGYVELPINTWDDVAEATMFIKTVQKACRMEVYCLEEIAWRRGLITTEQLRDLGLKQKDNPHGKYILSLIS